LRSRAEHAPVAEIRCASNSFLGRRVDPDSISLGIKMKSKEGYKDKFQVLKSQFQSKMESLAFTPALICPMLDGSEVQRLTTF